MCVTEIFSIIKDIVLSLAAGTTAIVAYKGLARWQKELKGKANFEVARSLIRATYRLRDEVEFCRSPFIPAREFPDEYNPMGRKTLKEEGDVYVHIYGKRWEPVSEAIQQFDSNVLEAEALWGTKIKEKTNEFRSCIRDLQISIEAFISNQYSGGADFEDTEYGKKVRRDISNMKKEENELTLKISNAIKEIENEIRPHLDRS